MVILTLVMSPVVFAVIFALLSPAIASVIASSVTSIITSIITPIITAVVASFISRALPIPSVVLAVLALHIFIAALVTARATGSRAVRAALSILGISVAVGRSRPGPAAA
jgi:hypothetical protein